MSSLLIGKAYLCTHCGYRIVCGIEKRFKMPKLGCPNCVVKETYWVGPFEVKLQVDYPEQAPPHIMPPPKDNKTAHALVTRAIERAEEQSRQSWAKWERRRRALHGEKEDQGKMEAVDLDWR